MRKERKGKGGGCLIAYKKDIETLVTEIQTEESACEALWIKVGNDTTKIKIGTVYMPGEKTPKKTLENAYREIEAEIVCESDLEEYIVCGDFNAKLKFSDSLESPAGRIMQSFINRNGLHVINQCTQCIGKWTRQEGNSKSVIDFVLSKNDALVSQMVIDEPKDFSVFYYKTTEGETRKIYSDHNAIKIELNWKYALDKRRASVKRKVITKKGLENYQYKINQQKVSKTINEEGELNQEYNKWATQIYRMYESEKIIVKKKKTCKVNRKLMLKIKFLKRMKRKRMLTTSEKIVAEKRIELMQQHIEEELKQRNRTVVKGIIKEIKETGRTDLQPFWKYTKGITRAAKTTTNMTVKDKDGNRMENKEEIIKEYQKHYQTLLSTRDGLTKNEVETEEVIKRSIERLHKVKRPTIKYTYEEIKDTIKTLKSKKAKDSSDWQNELLLHGGEEIVESLVKIFDMIGSQQEIPDVWENMWIKAIFKDARMKQVDKTRGLFMTNIISKVYEKVTQKRNSNEWEASTSPFQCGGKKGTSTIDHTLTILEIINRNKYLNKETYVIFIDMEKCFDKLWLESGIIELWKSGMNPNDAKMIYKMNKNANIIVHTPVGITDQFKVTNTVKQGTIYGPRICSKEIEKINEVNVKAVTMYSPRVEIEALTYVDDMTNAGSKECSEMALRNVKALEEEKKTTVNLLKSKYIIVNKKVVNESDELTTRLLNGAPLERTDRHNFLGTWIDKSGKCELNIKKRKEKCEMVLTKVLQMASQNKVGNLSTTIKIELYTVIIIPILLYNMEAWGNMTEGNLKSLEQIQASFLKRLLKLPKTTPYLGMLYEIGVWRIVDVLLYKKMMLLHNIIHSDDKRIIKRIIIDQDNYSYPGCWLEVARKEARSRQITTDLDAIKQESKPVYKKRIKETIQTTLIRHIRENETTKLRTVLKDHLEKRST